MRRALTVGLVAIVASGTTSPSRADPVEPDARASARRVVVVSPQGDVTTIDEALELVDSGGRIVVRDGTYRGGLTITRPVEIVAEGSRDGVVVVTGEQPCVRAAFVGRATVRGVVLQGVSESRTRTRTLVVVESGTLALDGCRLAGDARSGVRVHGVDARVELASCQLPQTVERGVIVGGAAAAAVWGGDVACSRVGLEAFGDGTRLDCKAVRLRLCASAIVVRDQAQGTLEDVLVDSGSGAQLTIAAGARATLLRLRLRDGGGQGAVVRGARAELFDCEVERPARTGLLVEGDDAHVSWRGGRIVSCGHSGVLVADGAHVEIEDVDVDDNRLVGIELRGRADGRLSRVRARRQGTGAGFTVHEHAHLRLDRCLASSCGADGLTAFDHAVVDAQRCRFVDARQCGVSTTTSARVALADVVLERNGRCAIFVDDAELSAKRCFVRDHPSVGVDVRGDARASFTATEVRATAGVGFHVENAELALDACRVLDGKTWGIRFAAGSNGRVGSTEIAGHEHGGVFVDARGDPRLVGCAIHGNVIGVRIAAGGEGTYEDCDLVDNASPWTVADPSAVIRKRNRPNE